MGIVEQTRLIDGVELEKAPEKESTRAKLEGYAGRGQTEPPQFKLNEMDIDAVLQARDRAEQGDVENLTPDDWAVCAGALRPQITGFR
jgi:hypothetical protein